MTDLTWLRTTALIGVLGLTLVACANADVTASPPSEPIGIVEVAPLPGEAKQVMTMAYRQIHRRHMEPVSTTSLAAAGINGLKRIDPAIEARREGNHIEFFYGATLLGREIDFETTDLEHAAGVTIATIDGARRRSPALREANLETIYTAVLGGMARSLDAFSSYRPPQAAQATIDSLQGFGGIGATLSADGPAMRVTSITPGSPAALGDLKVGDAITRVDGSDVAGWTIQQLIDRVRGPVGKPVQMAIARSGVAEPLLVTLTRARIVPNSVVYRREGDVAHIRLSSFNADTHLRLADALNAAREEIGADMKGVILDMRSNPGGTWSSMIRVADLFIAEGPIINFAGRAPAQQQATNASKGEIGEAMRVVILINGRSASASEVVAAALHDHGRAVLVGSTSLGKASAQVPVTLPHGGALSISTTHLFTPAGYSIHGRGILPDLCTAADGAPANAISREDMARWRASDVRNGAPFLDLCPRSNGERAIELSLASEILRDRARYQALLRPAQPFEKRLDGATAGSP